MSRTENSLTCVKNQMRPNEKIPCATITKNKVRAMRLMLNSAPLGSRYGLPLAASTSLPATQGKAMNVLLLSTSSTNPRMNLAR